MKIKVLTSRSSIFYLFNILFPFQETSVNTNIQVIEAFGSGYMVDILIL